MAQAFIVALSTVIAASAVSAQSDSTSTNGAPAGSAATRYCLRVEAITGSRIEGVLCLTREQWAEGDVDVDKEWAKEGVRVLNG
jgi:hypothetical protein